MRCGTYLLAAGPAVAGTFAQRRREIRLFAVPPS